MSARVEGFHSGAFFCKCCLEIPRTSTGGEAGGADIKIVIRQTRKLSDPENLIMLRFNTKVNWKKIMKIKYKQVVLFLVFALCVAVSTFAQTTAEEFRNQGVEKLVVKDYQGALKSYSECIRLSPANPDCYSGRASAYQGIGNLDAAIVDHNKAIEISPSVNYHYFRSLTYFIRGERLERETAGAGKIDFNKAFADINGAIRTSPGLPYLYSMRGGFYTVIDKNDSALADFTKAIELNPKEVSYYNKRAELFTKINNSKAALADYTKAIELLPNAASLYTLRGKIYYLICNDIDKYTEDKIKRTEREDARLKGIADFKKALQIDPLKGEAQTFLELLEMQ
jgi:tetratricopeptide (TPR) repeat protein